MISKELITYKTAQLAKQAGFNLPTVRYFCGEESTAHFEELYHPEHVLIEEDTLLEYWNNGWVVNKTNNSQCLGCKADNINYFETCSQPTQSLLQRWLREVNNCVVEVTSRKDYDNKIVYTWDIYDTKISDEETTDEEPLFDTYELALEQALQEALTLIINRKETNNVT